MSTVVVAVILALACVVGLLIAAVTIWAANSDESSKKK